jgi:hypothetical protein
MFTIERGAGMELAELERELLPMNENAPEYARAVLDYAARSVALLDDHLEAILAALSIQYLEPGEDARLIEDYRKEGRPLPSEWFGGPCEPAGTESR